MHQPLPPNDPPKYQRVLDQLQREMASGRFLPGARLPSEAALTKRFHVSRITVGRAVRELQGLGLVERRAGSGTYVTRAEPTKAAPDGGGVPRPFGLLIPDRAETEIFEPICQGMAAAPQARDHALLWGNAEPEPTLSREDAAWQLCRKYVEQGVGGVFFAPFERTVGSEQANRRIIATLEEARVAVVLLDRDLLPYPARSRHDLVGIDNRRVGYMACAHLLAGGSRRIGFLAFPDSAATVDARASGYREALYAAGMPIENDLSQCLDPQDPAAVDKFLTSVRPEAVICANDRVAGQLMHTLIALGRQVPRDLRLVGMDDVGYASLLPVPLTTIRQPCREIGAAAMGAMTERMVRPQAPARDILLDCRLVVRQSCGALRPASRLPAGTGALK